MVLGKWCNVVRTHETAQHLEVSTYSGGSAYSFLQTRPTVSFTSFLLSVTLFYFVYFTAWTLLDLPPSQKHLPHPVCGFSSPTYDVFALSVEDGKHVAKCKVCGPHVPHLRDNLMRLGIPAMAVVHQHRLQSHYYVTRGPAHDYYSKRSEHIGLNDDYRRARAAIHEPRPVAA